MTNPYDFFQGSSPLQYPGLAATTQAHRFRGYCAQFRYSFKMGDLSEQLL